MRVKQFVQLVTAKYKTLTHYLTTLKGLGCYVIYDAL